MKLTLKNIGLIEHAEVEMNGITVIAGENSTGKSTVGKALYSLFGAFYNIEEKIQEERISSISRVLFLNTRNKRPIPPRRKLAIHICENREYYLVHPDALSVWFHQELSSILDTDSIQSMSAKVLAYLKLDDKQIKINFLKDILTAEYNMQIGNIVAGDSESTILLGIKGENCIDVTIENDHSVSINRSVDIYTNVAYMEDPFVIDKLTPWPSYDGEKSEYSHRNNLIYLLTKKREGSSVGSVMEEMVVSERLNHIFDILNTVCEGGLVENGDGYSYAATRLHEPLSLSNMSTGFKTFLILKTLLTNGSIEDGGTIILDEPEIHLHPQWQLVFAELIVLIQKEFHLHVLMNTHSPYFLRAIQVYSAKHQTADVCKYYLSERTGERATIVDVSDNIDRIYAKLFYPLQQLEDESGW